MLRSRANQPPDLDSLCSAILLAYLCSHAPSPNAALHVPLANLSRADLKPRPELQAALGGADPGAGLPVDSLITLSELPDDLAAAADTTRWLLVDHNALTGDLARRFASRVVGCIDHHVDEGTVPPTAEPRIIQKSGSCASLVVDYARDTWRQLAAQQPDAATDRVLARLALAPILVDTSNLQSASKTEAVDRRAVDVAEAFLGGGGGGGGAGGAGAGGGGSTTTTSGLQASCDPDPSYDRTAFYDELSRLKNDIAHLSYNGILRKDYKQWRETPATSDAASSTAGTLTLGMSTVVQGMGYLLAHIGDRDTLLADLRAFAQQRRLDLAAIMTVQHDEGGFARQLLLWAFSAPAAQAAQRFLETNRETLGLEPWGDGQLDSTADGEWRTCWTQGRTELSRKQVAPYLRRAMREA